MQKNNNNNLHMTDSAKKQQTIYIWTDSAKKKKKQQQTIYIWTDSAKKLHWSIYSAPDCPKKKKKKNKQTVLQCYSTMLFNYLTIWY